MVMICGSPGSLDDKGSHGNCPGCHLSFLSCLPSPEDLQVCPEDYTRGP